MKSILCFGDSNTWGWDPTSDRAAPKRFPPDVRWPGVMRNQLGEGYLVIEEGLNARTTVWEDPLHEFRCGKDHLIPLLDSHAPLDLVIIFLGSNDMKSRFGLNPQDISYGAGLLVQKTIQRPVGVGYKAPAVLLIAPPLIGPLAGTVFEHTFAGAEAKSLELDKYYRIIAQTYSCAYLNAGDFAKSSPLDGLHLDAEAHAKLGSAIARKVREILGSPDAS